MPRSFPFALAAALVMASAGGQTQQSDRAFEEQLLRPTLRGLPGIFLLINTPAILTPRERDSIRTEAELTLRSTGIRLYSADEWMKDPSPIPELLLTVSGTVPATGAPVAWSSAFELSQGVRLDRDPRIYTKAVTWKLNGHFGFGPRDSIFATTREEILTGARTFANGYLAVNPK
jgi:hypothetical protein